MGILWIEIFFTESRLHVRHYEELNTYTQQQSASFKTPSIKRSKSSGWAGFWRSYRRVKITRKIPKGTSRWSMHRILSNVTAQHWRASSPLYYLHPNSLPLKTLLVPKIDFSSPLFSFPLLPSSLDLFLLLFSSPSTSSSYTHAAAHSA